MAKDVWACEDCGWEWPLPYEPELSAECDSCGGDLAKVPADLVVMAGLIEEVADAAKTATASRIDEWSAHLWHVSQHNRMVIALAGRLQDLANEMRRSVGLPEFGWNTAFPDARFRECSVHVEDCAGQETHSVASR